MGRCKNYEEERERIESLEYEDYERLRIASLQTKPKEKKPTKKKQGITLYHVSDDTEDGTWLWDYELNEGQRQHLGLSIKR